LLDLELLALEHAFLGTCVRILVVLDAPAAILAWITGTLVNCFIAVAENCAAAALTLFQRIWKRIWQRELARAHAIGPSSITLASILIHFDEVQVLCVPFELDVQLFPIASNQSRSRGTNTTLEATLGTNLYLPVCTVRRGKLGDSNDARLRSNVQLRVLQEHAAVGHIQRDFVRPLREVDTYCA
jgi:hypothetical protein